MGRTPECADGVEALLTIVSSHASPRLAERVNALLSNQLGTLFAEDEDDEDDIMARMTGMASDGRYGLDVSD
ncbi:hypothetical protein HaLaN_01182 [Haematococcus lacustris]|uniref:Uncharacterized protein n=1 Tax=Haematococcus lacustris TaxID=44745 RepID=A0A699YHP8_HAELA|nr:hypothetical protein HaLaN_01182 [Haematococcus lacustris]